MKNVGEFLGLRRNILIMLAGVVALGLGEELWSRFLPKYLETLGAGIWIIGVFGSAKDLLDALYQYPGGWLADRLGHSRSLMLFVLLALAGYGLLLVSDAWLFILVGMILIMAWGSSAQPAIFSIIGDNLPRTRRSIGFGVQSILKRIPIVIAPALGGWLILRYGVRTGMQVSFSISIILAVLVIVVIRRFYQESPREASGHIPLPEIWRGMDKGLKRLLVADFLARWAEGIPDIFIVLYVINILGYNALQFGTFTAIQMLTSIAFYIPVAKLSDRMNSKPYILLTFIFFALYPLSLLSAGGYAATSLAFIIGGLREIGEPARKALIVDFAARGSRGRVIGLYYFLRGILVFLAPLAGAWLWTINPRLPFYIAFLAGSVGVMMFAAFGSSFSQAKIETQESLQ